MTEQLIDGEIKNLMARIKKDHPGYIYGYYAEDDYKACVYKSELTDDEHTLYMAYSVWGARKELESGKLQNRKAFLKLTNDIDYGNFKWVKNWLNQFHKIKDVENHLNLVFEFYTNHHWSCAGYERLRDYKETILNAYLNIKKSEKTKEDHIKEFSAYE